MAKRIAVNTLNASSIDIINTIRQNASLEYQNIVPEVTKATDIPKVGEVLYGYPTFANYFISALVNRIALVRIKSATFNNPYSALKKGYLEFGETVEEAFVQIAKVRAFNIEKAESRELKRTLPDVKTAFHVQNWRVQYPITIQDEDLRMAFQSAEGVTNLIASIMDAVYTAAEYDEYLLFKYLLIDAISNDKVYKVDVTGNNASAMAVNFRSYSNRLTFMSDTYNASGVQTITPRDDQYIFMDSDFDAQFDVEVLAAAFNMDKATYLSHRVLIDDWSTFDNARFTAIQDESDMLPVVTTAQLAKTAKVRAVIVDKEWFQVYDNLTRMSDKEVASGLYWNYFYNVWKTVSTSPFSNIICFIEEAQTAPASITATVADVSDSAEATVITFTTPYDAAKFVQTENFTKIGVAIHPFGAMIVPIATLNNDGAEYPLTVEYMGSTYVLKITPSTISAGDSVVLLKQ